MNYSRFVFLALAATAALVAVVAGKLPQRNSDRTTGPTSKNDSLIPIGEGRFEGKLYFINTTESSWREAREMCRGNGMHLGSIKTAAQLQFLINSWTVDFNGDHWYDGRDSQKPSQFTWNGLGFEPADPIIDFGGVDIPYQLCLTYWSVTILSRTHAQFCTERYPVLCEVEVEDYVRIKRRN